MRIAEGFARKVRPLQSNLNMAKGIYFKSRFFIVLTFMHMNSKVYNGWFIAKSVCTTFSATK